VDVEMIPGSYATLHAYEHTCGEDEVHPMPGRMIASWEEREGKWVFIEKYL
jgi:hypothetical protein